MLILDTVGRKTMWGSEGKIGAFLKSTEENSKSKMSVFYARTRFHWILSSNKQENMERNEKEYETTKIFLLLLTLQDRILHPSTSIRDNKFKVFHRLDGSIAPIQPYPNPVINAPQSHVFHNKAMVTQCLRKGSCAHWLAKQPAKQPAKPEKKRRTGYCQEGSDSVVSRRVEVSVFGLVAWPIFSHFGMFWLCPCSSSLWVSR